MKTIISWAAGIALAIQAQAAFTPSNPPEMQPITNRDTPADREARLFRRGANLGNYLETWPATWHVHVSTNDFAIMKRQGFDHVRVPVGWQHYAGPAPDYALSPEIFARVDFAVTNALANQLAVMINIHHFDELDHDPAGATDEFLAIWRQVAEHYRDFPGSLVFELDNEPHENATTALMNGIYARAISEIRKTNPHRTIVVEPGNWGSIGELKNLALPADDNLMVSVHCYDPFCFTHQGATWANAVSNLSGIRFPGPPPQPVVIATNVKLEHYMYGWIDRYNTEPTDRNPSSPLAFEGKLKYLRAWSDYYGRPIHLGEFGCYTKADPQSRARYYGAMRRACEENGLGWAIWDWNSGFRYWDERRGQPMPGLRAALFGN